MIGGNGEITQYQLDEWDSTYNYQARESKSHCVSNNPSGVTLRAENAAGLGEAGSEIKIPGNDRGESTHDHINYM